MPSFTGVGAAVAAIFLTFCGLAGFIWILGHEDIINYINGWVLLGGFILLFLGALVITYKSASGKSPEAPHAAGAKAVGMQIVKVLLFLLGLFGLIFLAGIVMH